MKEQRKKQAQSSEKCSYDNWLFMQVLWTSDKNAVRAVAYDLY